MLPDSGKRPLTFLRFAIQRKKEFLRDVRDAYDGLVLMGNILLYQYRSTPSVIFMSRKPFFVDPMSYLFGQPYDVFKTRVKKGAPAFKPSFQKLMLGHGLDPEAFFPYDYTRLIRFLAGSDNNIKIFTDNALAFQWDNVWDTIREAKELMTDEQLSQLNEADYRPSFLIPPYFLYDSAGSRSPATVAGLNTKILAYCDGLRSSRDIFPMVFLKRDVLLSDGDQEQLLSVLQRYDFPGYCLWVEDFDEKFATASEISGLVALITSLAAGDKQVVSVYGGFFSMLLRYFGLTSVCFGLGYGETRTAMAAAQQGTGPAPIRYYLQELHSFLTLENALLVLRKRPDLICNCPACQRVLRGDPERVTNFQDEEALAEMHFLYNRLQEQRQITDNTLRELIDGLQWTLDLIANIDEITKPYRVGRYYEDRPIVDPSYINRWKDTLQRSIAT